MKADERNSNPVDIKKLTDDLLGDPDDSTRILALADAYAAGGEWLNALQQYNACVGREGSSAQKWYALYQAARMLDKLDFSTQIVVDAYFRAFDHRPEKIEPLVHIARHCRITGRLTTALDIIQVAMERESPDAEYFFEPETWAVGRKIEHLRICLAVSDDKGAIGISDKLLASGQISAAEEQLIKILRMQVSDPAQASVALGLPEGTGSDQEANPVLAVEVPVVTLPEATPRGEKRKLCIGMATYDDYDGVYFSVQAIRMYHPEVLDEIEILVVDNNPTGAAAKSLKELDSVISNYRYVPESTIVGTTIRDHIFREANADYVLVIDCHVFIVPGALRQLIDYFDAHPHTSDLLQGPLLHDDLETISTHFAPEWRSSMWGTWSTDPRGESAESEPFDIPMQGCGLFACRREAWPGFNPNFRGFGGEEGYIHEKVRQAGGRTLCLPFLRWMHRFNRPLGVPYPVNWESRIRNYVIGWEELGLDTDSIRSHFAEVWGQLQTDSVFEQLAREKFLA